MHRRTSSPLLALTAVVATLGLGACGNKTVSIHGGETEGIYLDVGQLKYQVEISRQLNPSIPEDRTFLSDVASGDRKLAQDELWFAVFVCIENETDQAQAPASVYTITDTEGKVYRPVSLGRFNPFRYTTDPVPAASVSPQPDSVAGENTSIAGRELLFSLKRETLDNRPLTLTIESASGADKATDDLDV